MRLVAAFDHRDIFIDPDADPAGAYEERRRLFGLPRSSWQDYNRSLISPGGGVWSRSAKEITLSPEAQAALGVSGQSLRPPDLVRAILSAPADLLWFGGIGTFVRAAAESDAEVGDRDDDRVRIDARAIRARVVAEGGNLACTPRARVQYSRRGGKINADFIDNAAGVATSDREVNLKILLGLAIERGLLAAGERDAVLVDVRDQVADEVLRQVGLSAVAITHAVPTSAVDLDAFEALMVGLEAGGGLDRQVDALPDAEELAVRRSAGAGMTRPELAVLLAHAKSDLTSTLARSPLMRDPEILEAVEAYFPTAVTRRFGGLIRDHRLYAQLAGTAVGSEIVDRMGITWAHETADQLGVGLPDAAAAYWTARQVLGADRRWRLLEGITARLSTDTELSLHQAVASAWPERTWPGGTSSWSGSWLRTGRWSPAWSAPGNRCLPAPTTWRSTTWSPGALPASWPTSGPGSAPSAWLPMWGRPAASWAVRCRRCWRPSVPPMSPSAYRHWRITCAPCIRPDDGSAGSSAPSSTTCADSVGRW
jgi:glutamate dehydrogenase